MLVNDLAVVHEESLESLFYWFTACCACYVSWSPMSEYGQGDEQQLDRFEPSQSTVFDRREVLLVSTVAQIILNNSGRCTSVISIHIGVPRVT
jgi:hypothetical protein